MPSIKVISATSADALSNVKFADVGGRGAIMNLWAAGDDAGDTIAVSVGDRDVLSTSEVNIEVSADAITVDRDQLLFDEIIPPGHIFLPVVATAEVQVLISLRYL